MKEYISNRLLALVVALALIVALVLCAKWRVLSSEAISSLLGVMAASLRDLLRSREGDTVSPSASPVNPVTVAGAGLICAACAGLIGGCTPAARQDIAQTVETVSTVAEVCHSASIPPKDLQACRYARAK